jgi:hypothetical protein
MVVTTNNKLTFIPKDSSIKGTESDSSFHCQKCGRSWYTCVCSHDN